MTTSLASSWVIAVAGFTGLISMWLVLACGLRSDRKSRQSRSVPSERTAPQGRAPDQQSSGADQVPPPPGPAGATIGPQRGVGRERVR